MDPSPEFAELISRRRGDLRAELAAILPPSAAIVLELGCGHGHFLARYAADFLGQTCVGVDISSERIERARRKSERAKLPNCHFIRADARDFLAALPPSVTFEEIWVLFPDPWPKQRHHKNRMLQPEFFEELASRAGQGTNLFFRTDHAEYFGVVAAFLPDLATWQPDPAAQWPLEHETVFQARADRYHSLVAVRTSHPATPAGTAAPRRRRPAGPTSPA